MRSIPLAIVCVLSLNGCAGEAGAPREVYGAEEAGMEEMQPSPAIAVDRAVASDIELQPGLTIDGEVQPPASTLARLRPEVSAGDGLRPYPPPGPDLDCKDIRAAVRVSGADPHRLDRDDDGIGCEEYQ